MSHALSLAPPDETQTPAPGGSVSGFRARSEASGEGSAQLDALEKELHQRLRELPKLFTERPTRPAPPILGEDDTHTPVLSSSELILPTPPAFEAQALPPPPPPPLPPPPMAAASPIAPPASFAPPASLTLPPQVETANDAFTATLIETRAIRRRLSRMGRGGIAFASIAIALLGILVFQSGTSLAQSPPPRSAHAVAVEPAPAPAVAPPGRPYIELGVASWPREAMVRIDQGPWLAAPFTAQVPRDDRDHQVAVSANGYFPRVVKVRFMKDALVDIVLQKAPSK